MSSKVICAVVICALAVSTVADEGKVAGAAKFPSAPIIDGRLDEEVWQLAEPVEGFIQIYPEFGKPSPVRTIVRFGYDGDAIYVGVYCFDPEPSRISAATTKRDGDMGQDDAICVMFDTFDDDRNGYYFCTNTLDTQSDGRLADNGRSEDASWDAAWQCATARMEDGWSTEFAIPFRIMKFRAEEQVTWGVNVARSYPRRLEISTWAGPLENLWRISSYGDLQGLDLKIKSKRYEIIPYALAQVQEGEDTDAQAGVDIRYRLTSNLGADITINPDFATIEADVEQVNLTRFELQIAEKRPFFLEGREMFQQRVKQFYSRRIGEIPWGSKLTGQAGGWDMAILAAQSDLENGTQGDATFTVLRGKRGVLGGSSNVGFLAANRRLAGENQGSVGLDTTLFFTDTLGMTAQLVRAHGPENNGALAWFIRPAYDSPTHHFHVRYSNWDEGLMDNMNAVGFVRDDNRKEFDTNLTHTFWLESWGLEKIETSTNYNRYWSQKGVLRSWELDSDLEVTLRNKWGFEISYFDEFKRYEKDFRNYRTTYEISYDTRTGRSVHASVSFGRNFDSDLQMIHAGAHLKITDALSVNYGLTKLWLDPDPENESTWIHVIRSNYYFNRDFFLKLFFQTNSVIDKKNVQAVMVWRFLPPFGSLQLAYQHGTSRFGTRSDQGHTLFTKLSWVF